MANVVMSLTSRYIASLHTSAASGIKPDGETENKMFNWYNSSKAAQRALRDCPAPADQAELTAADLDAVSGGLNPQPLPPIHARG